jgi:hypothetical protein
MDVIVVVLLWRAITIATRIRRRRTIPLPPYEDNNNSTVADNTGRTLAGREPLTEGPVVQLGPPDVCYRFARHWHSPSESLNPSPRQSQ